MDFTLKSILQEYLASQGEQNLNKFSRLLPIAVSGLRELNMDVSGIPKVVHLPVSTIDTISLPSDYIKYTRIGLCANDGTIHSLGANGAMCLKRETDSCGNIISEPRSNTGQNGLLLLGWDGFADNYHNGEMSGRFFGIGGGVTSNGYYRVDSAKGLIQLSSLPANTTHIVLEYIGQITTVDDSYQVHPFIVELLKSWIRWQVQLNNPNSQLGRVQMMEANYWSNYRIATRRFSSGTLDEWVDAIRFGVKLAPHY